MLKEYASLELALMKLSPKKEYKARAIISEVLLTGMRPLDFERLREYEQQLKKNKKR